MTYQPHQSEDATLKVAGCWCRGCTTEMMQTRFGLLPIPRFVVCPDCGCKRCPRAESHIAACTGRAEPGEPHDCSGCAENRERMEAADRAWEIGRVRAAASMAEKSVQLGKGGRE